MFEVTLLYRNYLTVRSQQRKHQKSFKLKLLLSPLDHRENILKTAKALVEDTKTLVAGAASSQEQLAVAAQNAVSTIVTLSDVVKNGAASLGSQNQEAQVMLINAVKDVTSALGDLMQATKSASGKNSQHPAMHTLKDSAKVSPASATCNCSACLS